MNVFITGATGFIGRHVLPLLAADSRVGRVYALCRNPVDLGPKVEAIIGDVNSLPPFLPGPADCCVHLAASTGRSSSCIRHANIDGLKRVLLFCRQSGVGKVIFVSSINARLKRVGVYGRSKLECEALVASSGLPYTVIRPALVYGPANPDGAISRMARVVSRWRCLPVFGDGLALEQPIHVDDLAALLSAAVFQPCENRVYEVGGGDALRYNDLVLAVAGQIGVPCRLLHLPGSLFLGAMQKLEAIQNFLPLSAEQLAHQMEDLDIDNGPAIAKFGVKPRPFREGLGEVMGRGPARCIAQGAKGEKSWLTHP